MPFNKVESRVNVKSDSTLALTNSESNQISPTKTELKIVSASISQTIVPGYKVVHFPNLTTEKFKKQGELVLKEIHPNLSLGKLNKLREEKRLGLYNPSSGELKVDERWLTFINNHNVKQVVYKNSSGDKTVLKNVKIQTLTGVESRQLDSAIADLYEAILYARSQKNEELSQAISNDQDSKPTKQKYVGSHTHVILKPSDYLIAFKPRSHKTSRSAREQDEINDKAANKRHDEKLEREKRDTINAKELNRAKKRADINEYDIAKNSKKKERANLGSQKNKENIRIKP